MTKDEKVTGIPEPWCESEGAVSWCGSVPDATGEVAEGRSDPLPPRRSRTTNPSSCSAVTGLSPAPDAAMVHYHRLWSGASCVDRCAGCSSRL